MKHFQLVWAALFLLFPANATEAPETAGDIIAAHLSVTGGATAMAQHATMKLTGTFNLNGETYPMTIYRQRPSSLRIELELEDGGQFIEASDGKQAWSFSSSRSQTPRILDPVPATRFMEELGDFDGALVNAVSKGHKVELVGQTNIDGTPCHHLRLTTKSGQVQDWYIQREDFTLVRKQTSQESRRRGPYQRTYYYESFQKVEGVLLPRYYEREDRQFVRAYQIDGVEFGLEIDASLFSPESIPAPTPEKAPKE